MDYFTTLRYVLLTLAYIAPGYVLCKVKKASADHLSTLSTLLVYVCSPCMMIAAFASTEFTVEKLINMAIFFVASLITQSLFMLFVYLCIYKKRDDAKYRIIAMGAIMGNVGFFGMPMIKVLLPQYPEAMCFSSMYTISMNLIVFTVGIYCLTGDRKYMTPKSAVLNPSMIALIISLPIFILGLGSKMPDMVFNAVDLLGDMTTPLCMTILGIRLASVEFNRLFMRPRVYLVCLLKLVAYPLFAYACVAFLPLSYPLKASMLILSSTPCASMILNMAEIHHSETELAANCVLLSTLLCFITIPLLTMIL